MVSATTGNMPQTPSQGPRAMSSSSSQPSQRGITAAARRGGNPTLGASYRESAASGGRQNLLVKVDPGAPSSKSNKEARLVEKKVCSISKAGNQRGRADSCPKPDFPHWQPAGKSSFRQRQGKGSMQKQQSHLGIGHQWSGKCHLHCFKYS